MVGHMRCFTKFDSAVMNLDLYTTFIYIQVYGNVKILLLALRVFAQSNRNVPNSSKMTISIAVLLGAYSYPWNWWYHNKLCMVGQFYYNFLSYDCIKTQFRCEKKEVDRISTFSKVLFIQVVKTFLQTISGTSIQVAVILLVLSDNCIVLSVKWTVNGQP